MRVPRSAQSPGVMSFEKLHSTDRLFYTYSCIPPFLWDFTFYKALSHLLSHWICSVTSQNLFYCPLDGKHGSEKNEQLSQVHSADWWSRLDKNSHLLSNLRALLYATPQLSICSPFDNEITIFWLFTFDYSTATSFLMSNNLKGRPKSTFHWNSVFLGKPKDLGIQCEEERKEAAPLSHI